jgi:hypothetical protein
MRTSAFWQGFLISNWNLEFYREKRHIKSVIDILAAFKTKPSIICSFS